MPCSTSLLRVQLHRYSFVPVLQLEMRGSHRPWLAPLTHHSLVRAPRWEDCGNEGRLELFYNATGAMFEHGRALGAHILFVEHRYYGESLPFSDNASFTPEGLQFLSIEQALADYASMIVALPGLANCKGTGPRAAAKRCDVILFGGSYGGMLAAWHRFKYPHLSVGAIASGAPIDFYPDSGVQAAFSDAVVATFAEGRPGCGDDVRAALAAADVATSADLAAAGVVPCAPFGGDSVERYAFYAVCAPPHAPWPFALLRGLHVLSLPCPSSSHGRSSHSHGHLLCTVCPLCQADSPPAGSWSDCMHACHLPDAG